MSLWMGLRLIPVFVDVSVRHELNSWHKGGPEYVMFAIRRILQRVAIQYDIDPGGVYSFGKNYISLNMGVVEPPGIPTVIDHHRSWLLQSLRSQPRCTRYCEDIQVIWYNSGDCSRMGWIATSLHRS